MNKYLCSNWQGFIQMIVYLVSRGYRHYCYAQYPVKKRDKWSKTDLKLIEKYKTDKSKFQRARLKQKKIANFYFLRWNSQIVILHTSGEITEDIRYDDRFYDIEKIPLEFNLSSDIGFVMSYDETVSVRLSKMSYRGFKAVIEPIKLKDKRQILREFNLINGIPAWAGIIKQKKLLSEYTAKQARKHQVKLNKSELRILTRRKIYKVFE